MKVSDGIPFKGLYNNKYVLNSLEGIANHGASFAAATSFLMAGAVRPLAIAATPNCDKENKEYAIANSIGSAAMKLAVVEACAIPVENAVKKIESDPSRYLKKETVERLMPYGVSSKPYKFASSLIKLGTNFLTAVPKSLLTIALIPILVDKFFAKKEDKKNVKNNPLSFEQNYAPVFDKVIKNENAPTFKGNPAVKAVSSILNNKKFGSFIVNHDFNSTNIARNISMATDVLLAGSFCLQTKKSKKIDEERKKPLIYNSLISTGASLLGGYALDKAVQKGTAKTIEKFKQANINNPKLSKYIEGINILRPTLIFAGVYYGLLPMISTYAADKLGKVDNSKK